MAESWKFIGGTQGEYVEPEAHWDCSGKYRKSGNLVELVVSCKRTGGDEDTNRTAFYMPVGYRPKDAADPSRRIPGAWTDNLGNNQVTWGLLGSYDGKFDVYESIVDRTYFFQLMFFADDDEELAHATDISGLDFDFALNDLSDANVSSPQDGEVLKYNAASEKFEPGQLDATGDVTQVIAPSIVNIGSGDW